MLLWHDMTTLRKGMQAYTCHILQHHHSTTPQPWFKHLFHLALCHQSSRHSCRSCAGKLLEQETKTNAWKIRKLGSNKILEKTACCNHILSGRKSRGMSHLNQTSESLWATINSDVSSRNSTHKRLLGSFLLQSLLNKSTLTVLESRTLHLSLWNRHHFWMLLANMDCNTNKYIYIFYWDMRSIMLFSQSGLDGLFCTIWLRLLDPWNEYKSMLAMNDTGGVLHTTHVVPHPSHILVCKGTVRAFSQELLNMLGNITQVTNCMKFQPPRWHASESFV